MKFRYLIGIVVLLAVAIVIQFLFTRPAARAPIPNPNGLDYYVNAANSLNDVNAYVSITNVETGGKDNKMTMQRYVATNQEALRQVRLGLGFRCEIPPKPFANGLPSELASFKQLSQLLRVEADLARSEGRTRDAAKAYLDGIRFGQEVSRGVLIYDLVGISIEYNACKPLTQCKEKLSHSDRQFVIDQLSVLRTNREPFTAVMEREKEFMRRNRTSPIQGITWPFLWYKLRPALRRTEDKGLQNTARLELLRTDLAIRNFRDANNRWPVSLSELKLDPPPLDPFSRETSTLRYSMQGADYLLYSIGPDGKDDAGGPSDLTLDSGVLTRPN